jgi:HME family heavy-metal exporter
MLVAALATFVLLFGGWQIYKLPIDVFPDLNRPRVVVMIEAPGLAPEEVETLITFPVETALNGASGVQAVRTTSSVGIAVIYVEFDWGTDIYNDRQIVAERLALASAQLPEGIKPQLAPISSIMGQIMIVGMYSEPNDKTWAFALKGDYSETLNTTVLPDLLRRSFADNDIFFSDQASIRVQQFSSRWTLSDPDTGLHFTFVQTQRGLEVHRTTSPMELRTLADWVVRQQMLTVPGVAQVFVMGGERKQFQVLVNPHLLLKHGVTLHEVESALQKSNQNTTGGYLDEQGPNEYLVRALGRIHSIRDLEEVVVKHRDGQSITVRQIARVKEGAQVKRGDSSAYERQGDTFVGGDAVVLTVNKQPGADTRDTTQQITNILARLEDRLPKDVRIAPELYQQKVFIDLAIRNVVEALRDGSFLVVIILFLFLLNFRTTFITLTAIPLSLVITGLVFHALGLSINTMTLGGLAVAIGELVDDAIVDVENIFRRLRENRLRSDPKPALLVVFQASVEIRNSIVFGTMIVVLVFIPLFALGGMEGRLFTPLGIAYIVSILSSLLVSLTVTPVLSYWLLPRARVMAHAKESLVLRVLKWSTGHVIRGSLRISLLVLLGALVAVGFAGRAAWQLENDFLPPFNEGAIQVNVLLPPGTSLQKSNEIAAVVERRLQEIPEVEGFVRKTGRAELDEHAEGVNTSEIIATLNPHSGRSRQQVLDHIRDQLADIPGITFAVEQPLSHLINHMISGVKAQVAIKLYGDDLDILRRSVEQMKAAIADVEGVKDLLVEPQVIIPQLRIEIQGHRLKQYGLTRGDITEFVETAMHGKVVSGVLDGQRTFDLLVRMDEPYREDLETLRRLNIVLPGGGTTRLGSVARIYQGGGPNKITREQVRRRILLQCNVGDRGLVDVVKEIKQRLAPIEAALPESYFIEYGGQFESQQSASRMIAILFGISLIGMFLVLYTMFRSANLALQVMVALPMAFIGSVAALSLTGQTLTVAAMVGFISLCGIASRNGILLINHYLHLVRFEGEGWTREMIIRAGKDRLAPVLMTALTSGIGLLPLAMAAGEPGKEILYPVATVIIGGLISSTLLEFLVRPTLFWKFGVKAARRVTEAEQQEVELVEESLEASG